MALPLEAVSTRSEGSDRATLPIAAGAALVAAAIRCPVASPNPQHVLELRLLESRAGLSSAEAGAA
ncbi:MAG: hypothetical protein ACXVY3_05240 [Gaiellaceae bacterium]